MMSTLQFVCEIAMQFLDASRGRSSRCFATTHEQCLANFVLGEIGRSELDGIGDICEPGEILYLLMIFASCAGEKRMVFVTSAGNCLCWESPRRRVTRWH